MRFDELVRKLNSVGKQAFVENFSVFQHYAANRIGRDQAMAALVERELSNPAGAAIRVGNATRIFEAGKEREALAIIQNSSRLSSSVRRKAQELSDGLANSKFAVLSHTPPSIPSTNRTASGHQLTPTLASPMANSCAVSKLEAECQALFSKLASLQNEIREKLAVHADGKNLKGNELVGWIGEIYGKLLFDGTLVDDRQEHDFVSADGKRVSVKARKGWSSGWRQTSAIPKIEGSDCPTHLLCVHLNDDYSVDRMWLLDWGTR